jgi:hypothetical protein
MYVYNISTTERRELTNELITLYNEFWRTSTAARIDIQPIILKQ